MFGQPDVKYIIFLLLYRRLKYIFVNSIPASYISLFRRRVPGVSGDTTLTNNFLPITTIILTHKISTTDEKKLLMTQDHFF